MNRSVTSFSNRCVVASAPPRHRADDLRRDGLEEVGAAPGAVADVVADEVGDDGGVARVILGNADLHLPHQVGADVRRLRVDPAAELREKRHERRAKAKAHQEARDERRGHRREEDLEDGEEGGDPEYAEADDEEAAYRATAQRHVDALLVRPRCRRRGPHICTHGDPHTDVTGHRGHRGTGGERECGEERMRRRRNLLVDRRPRHVQREEDARSQEGIAEDGAVLCGQEALGALADGGGHLAHRGRAFGLAQNPSRHP